MFVLSLITLTAVLFTACDKNNPAPTPVVNCDNFEVTIQAQGNTNLVATPSNGTSPYSYLWNDGSTNNSISTDSINVGTFSITVTDANGCTASDTFEITTDPCLSFIAQISLDSNNLTVATSGGTDPITYSWSTGATTVDIVPTTAGIYSVTATDANQCTTTDTYDYQPNPCDSSFSVSLQFVSDPAGNFLLATTLGGAAPYSYSWSNGDTGYTTNATTSGIYTINVTDANGCTATASYTVQAGCDGFLVDIIRNDSITTSIHFDAVTTAGTTPFTYEWGGFGSGTTNFVDIANGTSGPISVTVTDANGCVASDNDQF